MRNRGSRQLRIVIPVYSNVTTGASIAVYIILGTFIKSQAEFSRSRLSFYCRPKSLSSSYSTELSTTWSELVQLRTVQHFIAFNEPDSAQTTPQKLAPISTTHLWLDLFRRQSKPRPRRQKHRIQNTVFGRRLMFYVCSRQSRVELRECECECVVKSTVPVE